MSHSPLTGIHPTPTPQFKIIGDVRGSGHSPLTGIHPTPTWRGARSVQTPPTVSQSPDGDSSYSDEEAACGRANAYLQVTVP